MNTEALAAFKETTEWKVLIEHVEQIIIAEIKEHKGEAWYMVFLEIIISAAEKCSDEIVAAFKDSSLIPDELKNADKSELIKFVVTFLVEEVGILAPLFKTQSV